MPRSTTSLRLDDELRARLAATAERESVNVTALIECFVREGLDMLDHPGVFFKAGYAGRRPSLTSGPEIWTIASALRELSGTEAERIAALAEEFGIHERQVITALDYYATHRDEIDAWVQANDRAFEEGERLAMERQRLLA